MHTRTKNKMWVVKLQRFVATGIPKSRYSQKCKNINARVQKQVHTNCKKKIVCENYSV